jgi:hypothetical protein
MILLDRQLLFEARHFITGANVHRVKEMIFAYEQAVELHNHNWPTHREYHTACEEALREFVFESRNAAKKRQAA